MAPVFALLLLAMLAGAAPAALASTFVVNTTDDLSGSCTTSHCSLRQAISAANASPGADTIAFNLPETVSFSCFLSFCFSHFLTNPIQVQTPLPAITGPVTIDGTLQPHFSGSPLVEVRGAGATAGLVLGDGSDQSVIRSIAVTGFSSVGIKIVSSNNLVVGGRIGLDMTGAARSNHWGILLEGDNNRIGDSTSTGRNVISGNTGDSQAAGVVICRACNDLSTPGTGSNNQVAGNYIGTNVTGTAAIGNQNGVLIAGHGFNSTFGVYNPGPSGNIIGGGVGEGNVISGNLANGIDLTNAPFNTVVGANYIGLNAAGTAAVPNGAAGILLDDAPETTVGNLIGSHTCIILGVPATCPLVIGTRNVISGNTTDGIDVSDTTNTHDVAILGNNIGTDPGGTVAIPNGRHGVATSGSSGFKNNRIGAPNDAFGNNGNLIAFNRGAGVHVSLIPSLAVGEGQSIRVNRISGNGALGIDLNDVGTPDGPSPTNPPVLTATTSNSTGTIIQGLLGSHDEVSGTFLLDFYSNQSCDPSGFGEGATYLGTTSVALPTTSFAAAFSTPVAIGSLVTATMTHPDGTTTEFSQCSTVTSTGSTGTFSLSPRVTTISAGDTVKAQLMWTVPTPRVWRNLAGIDVRLVSDDGSTAMQVHWDQASNTFRLGGQPTGFAPGSPNRLETDVASLDLAATTVVGSGPTGPSVTLGLPLTFKPSAAGHTYRVQVAATDDFGDQDPLLTTGEWHVQAPR